MRHLVEKQGISPTVLWEKHRPAEACVFACSVEVFPKRSGIRLPNRSRNSLTHENDCLGSLDSRSRLIAACLQSRRFAAWFDLAVSASSNFFCNTVSCLSHLSSLISQTRAPPFAFRDHALGLRLAAAGFDVFLGNARGNRYSHKVRFRSKFVV